MTNGEKRPANLTLTVEDLAAFKAGFGEMQEDLVCLARNKGDFAEDAGDTSSEERS